MELSKNYLDNINALKSAILKSRYKAATIVNKELLILYFAIGRFISRKIEEEKWGAKIIDNLSADLQLELPGLRGFSASNIKRMRVFFEAWHDQFVISPSVTNQTQVIDLEEIKFSPSLTDQLGNVFSNVSFTHHIEILQNTKSLDERIFYIQKTAAEFWSISTLKNHLANQTFKKTGRLPNNFSQTIINDDVRQKALQSFKDEYLLDFLNIEDNDENDERVLESEIVQNIKKFLMSLGSDFAFIANQYRLIVEDEEYFLDLLFFNRRLQCLVVFELKTGKFKPEYMGKMNFYLSALDEYVKQPHEQTSIGIILCKEKKNKVIEFSFRDFNKAMGVSTYKTSQVLPAAFKGLLPDVETLKKLMD
ncbi:YhcG family protein [Pedobacter sp. Leaf170]|uniref:PDDEXK nuclease domain-containing protein n=1 Tax=Pedobacter sp. Leaf170 TaxID=2876558 RepID=UPI001E616961|nr:PDDEXK nuclease domain-containing protein [Pedobacter sp. Leaf170]